MQVKDAAVLADVHDAPWTIIRHAKAARQLGLLSVATATLDRLARVTSMHVNDAFAKTREHLLVCVAVISNLQALRNNVLASSKLLRNRCLCTGVLSI